MGECSAPNGLKKIFAFIKKSLMQYVYIIIYSIHMDVKTRYVYKYK